MLFDPEDGGDMFLRDVGHSLGDTKLNREDRTLNRLLLESIRSKRVQ
jgi:hypothetical protein